MRVLHGTRTRSRRLRYDSHVGLFVDGEGRSVR
jgi:hypothetical protein